MKLGIACVYYFDTADSWVLEVQLEHIATHTKGYDFCLYAAANRLLPELKEKLAAYSFVKILDLPMCDVTGGPEHGFYLDAAVQAAANDGCTHICTLDCDSFPVSAAWPTKLATEMGNTYRLAAVFRAENLDACLPHPCGYFMTSDFARDIDAQFYPLEAAQKAPEFQRFLKETGQRLDTGIGYAFRLWQTGENWLKLTRSNRTDIHFLMAGIYDDVFFHIGAGSRAPVFARDLRRNPLLRLTSKLENVRFLWTIFFWLKNRYVARNRALHKHIKENLQSDSKTFINSLR